MKFGEHVSWGTLLAAAAAVTMLVASQGAMAAIGSIVASKHDFSTTGPNATYKSSTQTQVCVYCHAPHNTGATPLWNHASSTATYTLYTSPTMNATTGQPGTTSKLCLSCHDGMVAVDSFGGATGTKMVTGSSNLGTDLSNDHPIGFTYDTSLLSLDPGLKDPSLATVTIGTGNTGTIAAKMLFTGKLECASCHDVHNSASGTAVESKLLRVTTAGSAMCVACHVK
jgi:predicted CXXCH cytochrome family protein